MREWNLRGGPWCLWLGQAAPDSALAGRRVTPWGVTSWGLSFLICGWEMGVEGYRVGETWALF